jgi:hypothetical protein
MNFNRKNLDRGNPHTWIGIRVDTETGLTLGWLQQIQFIDKSIRLANLTVAGSPLLWVPDIIAGQYNLENIRIISLDFERLVIPRYTEHELDRTNTGTLNRLGIIRKPWEIRNQKVFGGSRDDRDYPGSANVPRSPKPDPQPMDDAAAIPFD